MNQVRVATNLAQVAMVRTGSDGSGSGGRFWHGSDGSGSGVGSARG